jgi:hypothetical protein
MKQKVDLAGNTTKEKGNNKSDSKLKSISMTMTTLKPNPTPQH